MNQTDIRARITATLGTTVRADIRELPAGNFAITVIHPNHTATIDGADSGWGWTIDPVDDFAGHDHAARSLDEALNAVRTALAP